MLNRLKKIKKTNRFMRLIKAISSKIAYDFKNKNQLTITFRSKTYLPANQLRKVKRIQPFTLRFLKTA
jgi:hypothetical protein